MTEKSNFIVNYVQIWNLTQVVQITKMVQNSFNILTFITQIVFFSYNPVGLMVFIRSSSKNVSYSSIVRFSHAKPFCASGSLGYQLKGERITW